MLLTIVSPASHAGSPRGTARFDATGGTVGRAATNMLVLDDAERTVSRVHAQVVYRSGRFYVVDRGSNPLSHNGRALGAGNEAPLAEGDRLTIGGFELEVREANQAGGVGGVTGGANAAAAAPLRPPAAPVPAAPAFSNNDPFADLLAEFAPKAPVQPAATPGRAAPLAHDPFADLLAPLPSAAPPPAVIPADFADLAPKAAPSSSSIDALFGLGSFDAGADPLGGPLMVDPLQPNTAGGSDPFLSLQSGPVAGAPAASNHVPLLNTAFEVPAPRRVVPPPPEVTAPWPPPPAFELEPVAAPTVPPVVPPVVPPNIPESPVAATLPPDWDPLADLMAPTPAPVFAPALSPAAAPVPVDVPVPRVASRVEFTLGPLPPPVPQPAPQPVQAPAQMPAAVPPMPAAAPMPR